jgi:putative transposase
LRCSACGFVYHVLNWAVGRATLFGKSGDYAAFEKTLRQAKDWRAMRVLAFCIRPNHWHLLLWPYQDGDLSEFLRWLTVTHTQRWHAHQHTAGTGPLYQGRFKSFPVAADDHFLTVARYVERNPLRSHLVAQAETWRWSSLWHRVHGSGKLLLDPWPVLLPGDWVSHVNRPESAGDLEAVRRAAVRGSPFGMPAWVEETARTLGLGATLRARGRPPKRPPQNS